MPYCTQCGKPVEINDKFCPNCGVKLEVTPSPETVAAVTSKLSTIAQPKPQANQSELKNQHSEQILTIIPNLSVCKGWGRFEVYNLIVTEKRSIVSKLTNDMMKRTIQARRARAESEGKGFIGKWKAQMQGFNTYIDYYEGMSLDKILNENTENYSFENSSIQGLKIRNDTDDDGGASMYLVEIQTNGKNLQFKTQYDPSKIFHSAYNLSRK